jgi:hypothetical protein
VTRTLYGDTLSIEATLERIEQAPRRTRVRRVVRSSSMDSTERSTSPRGRLKGYKLEPY